MLVPVLRRDSRSLLWALHARVDVDGVEKANTVSALWKGLWPHSPWGLEPQGVGCGPHLLSGTAGAEHR